MNSKVDPETRDAFVDLEILVFEPLWWLCRVVW